MKITRTFAAAFICATALALAAPHLSAQAQPTPRDRRPANPSLPQQPPVVVERPEPDIPPEPVEQQVREYRRYRPVVRVGQDYWLKEGETASDIRTVFGDVVVEGRVDHDLVVVFGTARLAPTAVVGGNLVVVAGTTTIEEGAAVHEALVVAAGSLTAPVTFAPGGDQVVIGTPMLGGTLRGIVPWFTRGLLWGRLIVPDLAWIWAVVGVAFLVGLLINTVFDGPVRGCAETIAERPLSAFLIGLLVAVLTVPVIAILAATVIGIIVVPFVICAVILAAIVGRVGVQRAIGYGIVRPATHEGRAQALVAFVLGFAVLVFAYMVPIIGVLTWTLTGVLGLGAAAATFRAGLRREHPARVRPAATGQEAGAPVVPPPTAAAAAVDPDVYAEPAVAGPAAVPVPPIEVGAPLPASASVADVVASSPRATFLDRVAAFALDCVLVAIAYQVLDLSNNDGAFMLLLFAYHVAFWAWKGTTLGGIICAVRVIRMDRQELRFVDSLVRGLTAIFSLAALGIGCFWMLQDPERQMWHDKVAGTIVVKVPRQLALP